MNVVIIYQSRTGKTRRAAELIGGAIKGQTSSVVVRSTKNIDYKELTEADLIFVGTWVDGLIFFGHRPGDLQLIRKIPPLWGKRVAAFTTHAVFAGSAPEKLAKDLANRGANLIAAQSLHRKHLEVQASDFVNKTMANM